MSHQHDVILAGSDPHTDKLVTFIQLDRNRSGFPVIPEIIEASLLDLTRTGRKEDVSAIFPKGDILAIVVRAILQS